jgi:hypothetical protein
MTRPYARTEIPGEEWTMRIGLVSCVKSKLGHAAPDQDLYTSALFRGARRAVELNCDRWYILSALHGLVPPDRVLEPYDKTLSTASTKERRAWAGRVLEELSTVLGPAMRQTTFEIHAGAAYEGFGLSAGLRRSGSTVELPLAGLRQGERLRWYKQHGCL